MDDSGRDESAAPALKAARDRAWQRITAGIGVKDAFCELVALNAQLGEVTSTIYAFAWLDQHDWKTARDVFEFARPVLVKAGERRLYERYLDPRAAFARFVREAHFGKRLQALRVAGNPFADRAIEKRCRRFTESCAALVAFLVVTGQSAIAKQIAAKARRAWNAAGFRASVDFYGAIDAALTGRAAAPPTWRTFDSLQVPR